MNIKKSIGVLAKYIPFIAILALHVLSLCRGITTISEEMERNILIWTDALIIGAVVGEIGSLLVIDRFNVLLTGKTPNIVQDIIDENSQDVAVMYNGIVASSFLIFVILALNIVYMTTEKRLFSIVATILATLWAIGTIIYIFAGYLKIKNIRPKSIFSQLSNPVFLPVIISMIQILITRKNWVGNVYHSIYMPTNTFALTVSLIILLCYFLAIAFCHFSNIYCLLAFGFLNRDLSKIQTQLDCLCKKEEKQEAILRRETKNIDEKAEQVCLIKRIRLCIRFIYIHIKVYIQGRFGAVAYLLALLDYKITKLFHSLLKPKQIRINGIRFCLITAVFELLLLDYILFIYLESDNPCLKFFELLSTVIIIPILLSWLADLKSKAHEKHETGQEVNPE